MILQSLVKHYEELVGRGELERPGWNRVKVSYALNLNTQGELLDVIPLKVQEQRGKKEVMVPRVLYMPTPVTRTVGIAANFLCDNSAYFLGTDKKGNPKRSKECFMKSRELHLGLLSDVDNALARSICTYFSSWNPDTIHECPALRPFLDDITDGANLIFMVGGRFAQDDEVIRRTWERHYEDVSNDYTMQCLVTGRQDTVAKLHPSIKGVRDAQSSGASLVSFNARAYESYGHDDGQGANAPVSEYAAFAYGAVLNYLLSDRRHTLVIGDTTVVYWAEGGEPAYQDIFKAFINGPDDENIVTDSDLNRILKGMAAGRPLDWNGISLKPDNHFHILGLAPNAARLAVRFFMQDSFGNFADHLKAHFNQLEIVKSQWDTKETLPLWKLFAETVNQNARVKTPSPQMVGDTTRAILTGARYPATLMTGVSLRIKAEHEITRGRAAIIKAYLLRNNVNQAMKEVLTVELNEQTIFQPYLLGRLFSLLEQIQEAANPGINATIRDKYFNSACATPASIFPLLIKLSGSHLRKLDTGRRIFYERQITDIIGKLSASYSQRLGLPEQGIFQLGYYHQTQKRYEKKNNGEENKNVRTN
jgi:CRISPR-associated protein Csd1